MSKPMMINDNGVTRPMTEEESKAMERLTASISPPEPTAEERIERLEEQLKAAKILLGVE